MNAVEWNLESLDVETMRLIQVHLSKEAAADKGLTPRVRLLALSHAMAYIGIPAFFVRCSPGYVHNTFSTPAVIVFDTNGKFDNYPLDKSEYELIIEIVRIADPFCAEFYDALQRAMCLVSYYELRYLKPLYFTSYLLFPGSECKSEPFLYQKVPVRRNGILCVRTTLKGSLDFIIRPKGPITSGSFVLLPPHEHPFYVLTCSSCSTLTLLSVGRETITVDYQRTAIVLITRPPAQMASFYTSDGMQSLIRRHCKFEAKNFFTFRRQEVEDFFTLKFSEGPDGRRLIARESFLEYPELTVEQVIGHVVADPTARAAIYECIGKEATLPSRRFELHIRASTFLSFFRFEFGFSDVRPPFHAQTLIHGTFCAYERLGIPNVSVGCGGTIIEVPADSVVDRWVENFYQPISGPKSGHYIVVCTPEVPLSHAKVFFDQLSHTYQLHQFGSLTVFPRFEAYYSIPVEDMGKFITRFYQDQSLSEFQQFPLLTFIVGPPIYDPHFRPCSILSYVKPESITTASTKELAAFAFVVYSRIRTFSPEPFGMLSIAPLVVGEAATSFYGFRYQPPFVLQHRDTRRVTMHIAWDHVQDMSVWMDDVGSVLHFLDPSPIDKLFRTMRSCLTIYAGSEVNFTISVLAGGVTAELREHILNTLGPIGVNITLFAVSPEPTVQVLFREEFQDDAIIVSDAQQFHSTVDGEFERPLATCYVVAHVLPAYSVSLYTRPIYGTAESTVRDYVRHMSHLSWLSVKPGAEGRTISYPPHVCALIRKIMPSTTVLSRYEFLPSTEII